LGDCRGFSPLLTGEGRGDTGPHTRGRGGIWGGILTNFRGRTPYGVIRGWWSFMKVYGGWQCVHIFGSMGNKLYLCVGALLCGWGENIMQVGVHSSSPGIGDRPLTTIVVVAHNKDREIFFNIQGVGDFFIRNIIRIFVLMLYCLGGYNIFYPPTYHP